MLLLILRPSSPSLWCLSQTKDMQTDQLLCWNGITDTERSTTSSSNEEEHLHLIFLTRKSMDPVYSLIKTVAFFSLCFFFTNKSILESI